MNTTMGQLRRLNDSSRELATSGLKVRGLALLSMIDGYLKTYQRNYKRYPPAISLNQKQWNLLGKSAQLVGLELSELTHCGISFHLVEESPEVGSSGIASQFKESK
jgi:hypothetical protein